MTGRRHIVEVGKSDGATAYAAGTPHEFTISVPTIELTGVKKSWLQNAGLLLACLIDDARCAKRARPARSPCARPSATAPQSAVHTSLSAPSPAHPRPCAHHGTVCTSARSYLCVSSCVGAAARMRPPHTLGCERGTLTGAGAAHSPHPAAMRLCRSAPSCRWSRRATCTSAPSCRRLSEITHSARPAWRNAGQSHATRARGRTRPALGESSERRRHSARALAADRWPRGGTRTLSREGCELARSVTSAASPARQAALPGVGAQAGGRPRHATELTASPRCSVRAAPRSGRGAARGARPPA